MNNPQSPRITGFGFTVPAQIRTNDDPIFDWLKKNNPGGEQLFQGYDKRHVLSPGENIMDIMLPAAQLALKDAGAAPAEIDLLIGTGSISEYRNPNVLSQLHSKLALPANTWVIPVECEFSNFNASLILADSMMRAGRIKKALICIGGNWTRNVDYHTAQAVSAADGAAAFVLEANGSGENFAVIDYVTITDSKYYGSMYTDGDCIQLPAIQNSVPQLWTDHFFHITSQGIEGFKEFGVNTTPMAATALMKKHKLKGKDISLITHQASSVLMDHWNTVIKPAQYINTIKNFANMALANIPVTLAWAVQNEPVKKDNLILLAIGPDMHANAVLLQRKK